MKDVQAFLSARKDLESRFNQSRGLVKLLQAALGLKKDVEGSFHHHGSPVMLVQAAVLTAVQVL